MRIKNEELKISSIFADFKKKQELKMINRRHIRVKVMQSIYAMFNSKSDDLPKEEKFLTFSINKMYDLYFLLLNILPQVKLLAKKTIELSKKKHFATREDLNPNTKFIDNKVIALIENSESFKIYKDKLRLSNCRIEEEYIRTIFKNLKNSKLYKDYMKDTEISYEKEVQFLVAFYSEFIAPSEALYSYFEDFNLSWANDIPYANSWVVRTLENLNKNKLRLPESIYKNEDDKNFVLELFRKVILNNTFLEKEIENKTPNWEIDRIANIDMILIKMGLCEFLHFSTIPEKATMNEYIEIAKDYSGPKSGVFVNGVLNTFKSYEL